MLNLERKTTTSISVDEISLKLKEGLSIALQDLFASCFYYDHEEDEIIHDLLRTVLFQDNSPNRQVSIRGSVIIEAIVVEIGKEGGVYRNPRARQPQNTFSPYLYHVDHARDASGEAYAEINLLIEYLHKILFYTSGRNADIRMSYSTLKEAQEGIADIAKQLRYRISMLSFGLSGSSKAIAHNFSVIESVTESGHPYCTIQVQPPLPWFKGINIVGLAQNVTNARANTSTRQQAMTGEIVLDNSKRNLSIRITQASLDELQKPDRMLFEHERSRKTCLLKIARMLRVAACYPHSQQAGELLIMQPEIEKIRQTYARSNDDLSELTPEAAAEIAGNFLVAYSTEPVRCMRTLMVIGIAFPYLNFDYFIKNEEKLTQVTQVIDDLLSNWSENFPLRHQELTSEYSADVLPQLVENNQEFSGLIAIFHKIIELKPGYSHKNSEVENFPGLVDFNDPINLLKLLLLFSPVEVEKIHHNS